MDGDVDALEGRPLAILVGDASMQVVDLGEVEGLELEVEDAVLDVGEVSVELAGDLVVLEQRQILATGAT